MSYAAAEAGIAKLLRENLPAHINIEYAESLEQVLISAVPPPAVHVLYHGEEFVEPHHSGKLSAITNRYLVIVNVLNVATIETGETARADADPLIELVVGHLIGKSPALTFGALRQIKSPYRRTYEAGSWWYPLAFVSDTQIRSLQAR